jgi:hypothetical protein
MTRIVAKMMVLMAEMYKEVMEDALVERKRTSFRKLF